LWHIVKVLNNNTSTKFFYIKWIVKAINRQNNNVEKEKTLKAGTSYANVVKAISPMLLHTLMSKINIMAIVNIWGSISKPDREKLKERKT
jgi:hypothetical protein